MKEIIRQSEPLCFLPAIWAQQVGMMPIPVSISAAGCLCTLTTFETHNLSEETDNLEKNHASASNAV